MDRTRQTSASRRRERRLAGSDAERRAALQLRDDLRARRRGAEIEPFRFHQRWALAQAVAAGLAVVGSVVSVSNPAVGAALVAFAALSSILEAAGVTPAIARSIGTRASQNVSSPPADGSGAKPGLLVIAGGYDTPRDSTFRRLGRRLPQPLALLGVALAAVLACCLARVAGAEGDALTVVQLIPTLFALAAVGLLVDAELAAVGDGVAEAAGTELAIALAAQLAGELEHLDVWLVLAGAQGARGAGMRAWRRRHRDELQGRPAVTIEVGAPEPDAVEEVYEGFADLARRLDAQLSG
jgi:hypothetical protein